MIEWEGLDMLSDSPQDACVCLFVLIDFFFSLHFCLHLKAFWDRDCEGNISLMLRTEV